VEPLRRARFNGFLGNDIVRIPLPKVLQDVQSYLAPIGADGLLVELQTQLNRGAEKAAPIAKDIFLDTIRGLTITDAFDILRGSNTAATEYLQSRTTTRLSQLFGEEEKAIRANPAKRTSEILRRVFRT